MTTPLVCRAYVINLICMHSVNSDYGALFITQESDNLLSLGLNRFLSVQFIYSIKIQKSLWQILFLVALPLD